MLARHQRSPNRIMPSHCRSLAPANAGGPPGGDVAEMTGQERATIAMWLAGGEGGVTRLFVLRSRRSLHLEG
jgi:hypothetical protein